MTEQFSLRPMQEQDLAGALRLTQAEKWPHRAEDWALHLQQGRGWVACDQGGQVIGTTLLWEFGAASNSGIGTVGLIVVSRHWQGRGVGRQLLELAMESASVATLRLMATEAGIKLYGRCGFVPTGTVQQRQAIPGQVPLLAVPAGLRLRRAQAADLASLVALDAAAFGCERARLLQSICQIGRTMVLEADTGVLEDDTGIKAFASIRRGGRGLQFGPVVAANQQQACVLISALLQDTAEFIRLDVPREALQLGAWLDEIGLPVVDQVTAMQRGPVVEGESTNQQGNQQGGQEGNPRTYALVSQAFG
ncbi:MAG: GNAT family N-acetyltransferase [Gammaproteobacteria bacterium]|uniref:GNAT family N-acetyltransferase n=1 Tax=Pseudomaricurvus alcaniphilus TaxID=1166482 RepID=UPI00140B1FE7|nr:GNAT family N-acetyltransferase [Pseudomaricurvus alcaniphilus]MBR9908742.1 GNAT family N-acetyltransferase [Gammaproteobacteria bacterium]NHN37838.1 GNAT family N-acetyltransferase [Pseudomaricurvus alcaniphilus]